MNERAIERTSERKKEFMEKGMNKRTKVTYRKIDSFGSMRMNDLGFPVTHDFTPGEPL